MNHQAAYQMKISPELSLLPIKHIHIDYYVLYLLYI